MNHKDVLKILREDGWIIKSHNGTSHIQLVHPTKPGKVTVSAHGKRDIPPGTLKRILKQAGL